MWTFSGAVRFASCSGFARELCSPTTCSRRVLPRSSAQQRLKRGHGSEVGRRIYTHALFTGGVRRTRLRASPGELRMSRALVVIFFEGGWGRERERRGRGREGRSERGKEEETKKRREGIEGKEGW